MFRLLFAWSTAHVELGGNLFVKSPELLERNALQVTEPRTQVSGFLTNLQATFESTADCQSAKYGRLATCGRLSIGLARNRSPMRDVPRPHPTKHPTH